MMKKILLITLLGMLLITCKQQPTPPLQATPVQASVADSLSTVLDSLFSQSPIVGASAVILTKDSILYTRSFGHADVANNKPYTQQTIQNIGSVSKTSIGLALLKAQEMGKLSLDDPINSYLPFTVTNPKYPKTPITIRQLTAHTSSINDTDWYGKSYVMLEKEHPSTTYVLEYFSGPESDMSLAEYLKKVLTPQGNWYEPEIFGDDAPGATFEYSNIAATLAAMVLEGAVGTTFDAFTTKHIFTPLKMTATGWNNAAIEVTNRSKNYQHKDTLIAAYKLITYPDGGLITSTQNLSLYLSELMKGYQGVGTILTKESYQELFKKQLVKSQLHEDHGDGNTGIFMDYSKHGIGHNGGDPGVVTFMYFNAETGIGKILFMNTDYDTNPAVINSYIQLWKTMDSYANKLK